VRRFAESAKRSPDAQTLRLFYSELMSFEATIQ